MKSREPHMTVVPPSLVVEAAPVPIDEPTPGLRDQLAERRDPILEGHLFHPSRALH